LIKAVIFDFDGLILDTESTNYYATRDAYGQLGITLPLKQWQEIFHNDSEEQHHFIENFYNQKIEVNVVNEMRRTKFREYIPSELRSGVFDYIQAARNLGLHVCLATNADRYYIELFTKKFGIYDYFTCIKTREDVAFTKPNPEVYNAVLRELKIMPYEALAFEDSPNGAHAANEAGISCIVVTNPVTAGLNFPKIDKLINSLSEISLSDLIDELTQEII
jgi:putative hydrolase of the HAD superfamily